MTQTTATVIIVGAGPAGLAVGAALKQRGIDVLLLESGDRVGMTWHRLYESLHLHTIKSLSQLPGFPMPRSFPRFPTREQVVAYLNDYATHWQLPIQLQCRVTQATHADNRWQITTTTGTFTATYLVAATGTFANPQLAQYPDQELFGGTIMHVSAYHDAAPFAGQQVLVVGAGNSSNDIILDLVAHDIHPTVAIRAGANVVPFTLLGLPIQLWGHVMATVPRLFANATTPLLLGNTYRRQRRVGMVRHRENVLTKTALPIIGLGILQQIRQGNVTVAGAIDRYTATGVVFADGHAADFATVILATGYQPAFSYLATSITVDEQGLPAHQQQRSTVIPTLYFSGLNNDMRGLLYNLRAESRTIAKQIDRAERVRRRQARRQRPLQPMPVAVPVAIPEER